MHSKHKKLVRSHRRGKATVRGYSQYASHKKKPIKIVALGLKKKKGPHGFAKDNNKGFKLASLKTAL